MSSLPFRVKAVYEYDSPHDDDLHFPNGQIITVTEDDEEDWYTGNYVDASGVTQEGIFPRNFVEKYEPTAPPRPTRVARPKKEEPLPEPVREPTPEPVEQERIQTPEPAPEPEPMHIPEVVASPPAVREPPPPASKQQVEASSPPVAKAVPKPAPSASKPAGPPPVSEKPSSFRDRIAAFNKAAPPPAPFKPGGLGGGSSNTFIKKPFVAPPPSKNAYVPVPREAPPPKIYRREEDPEIAAKESENQELAERSGLAPTSNEGEEEEQPKTTLKERIALLQKQQMEQASRHADAAQKKEKPKRPVKKRVESQDTLETTERARDVNTESEEPVGRASTDSAKDGRPEPRRRKSSRAGIEERSHLREAEDGNDADMSGAGETTEEPGNISTGLEDNNELPRRTSIAPPAPARAPAAPAREPDVGEEEGASEEEPPLKEEGEEEEEEEEEDIDPEVRRKEELRARMAKMSGGMGMHGMFGPPAGIGMGMPPMAPPKKKKPTTERRVEEEEEESSPISRAPPVPMIPMPGMTRVRSPEAANREPAEEETSPISSIRPADKVPDVEDVVPQARAVLPVPTHESGAPPVPGGRPAPPPVPKESRPFAPMSPDAGSESDYEDPAPAPEVRSNPPPPPSRPVESAMSPLSPGGKRMSYFGSDQNSSPISPTTPGNKRLSRAPPPIPGAGQAAPPGQPQSRAVPPPPAPLGRSSTFDQQPHPAAPSREVAREDSEEEVTEYDGDYDTDIASAVPHKDALQREPTAEDSPLVKSPTSAPPPLPPTAALRSIPPPLPSQPPPPITRKSVDMPRGAPPPLPPQPKMPAPRQKQEEEYDPYNYSSNKPAPPQVAAPILPPRPEAEEEDLYSASPPRAFAVPAQERSSAPTTPGMSVGRGPVRQSTDIPRTSTARRSVEMSRMSMDSGFVANDIDLAAKSFWWTQPKGMPPVLQGRRDVLLDTEDSSSKQGSKSIITKEIFILYLDYSQTIITAEFDAQNPADVKLEQRHEQPPARQRQDQLEQAHEKFGRRISEAVNAKKESIVGDGTPHGLITELLRPLPNALLPIGTRAYGAVIYSNLANASTSQNDEIRPGDIITLRNTIFKGKHGPMHAKYSVEVGKPDHVGVVAEWDGTKKKVKAWEQGRESKKVRVESFKLDDLRSGEVKIWRVMPRGWVGWGGK